MATVLLKAGADPFVLTIEGFSPLHIASMRGFAAVSRAILDVLRDRDGSGNACGLLALQTKQRYRGRRITAHQMALLPPLKSTSAGTLEEYLADCGMQPSDEGMELIGENVHEQDSVACLGAHSYEQSVFPSKGSGVSQAVDVWDAHELTPTTFATEYFSLQRPGEYQSYPHFASCS